MTTLGQNGARVQVAAAKRLASHLLTVVGLALTAACGGASTSAIDPGCFAMAEAVNTFNDAQDATKAGTATATDTMKTYASAADKLTTAANILPAGQLKDLATAASTAMGRARVALDGGGTGDADRIATLNALNEAAPLCKGHTP